MPALPKLAPGSVTDDTGGYERWDMREGEQGPEGCRSLRLTDFEFGEEPNYVRSKTIPVVLLGYPVETRRDLDRKLVPFGIRGRPVTQAREEAARKSVAEFSAPLGSPLQKYFLRLRIYQVVLRVDEELFYMLVLVRCSELEDAIVLESLKKI